MEKNGNKGTHGGSHGKYLYSIDDESSIINIKCQFNCMSLSKDGKFLYLGGTELIQFNLEVQQDPQSDSQLRTKEIVSLQATTKIV